ncbi:MAG: GNAT family N-acetyltransferase [Gaiellaceae bacterium]
MQAASLVEVEPAAWDGLLERLGCADAYLQRDYLEVSAVLEREARPALLHAPGEGGDVVFPCLLRGVPELGVLDATNAYGYGGPVAVGAQPPVAGFADAYERWCAETGVVSTFVRFHPLFENHRTAPPSFRRERVAGSVAWRLEGDLVAGMHPHHRRAVRKAERTGVEVDVRLAPASLTPFAALHEETMRRQDAAPFYFFPPAYWQGLTARLGARLLRLDAWLEGTLVASVLCLATPPWLHYHLGATSVAARGVGASHLLMLTAALWGQARGFEQFHLGAGVGGGGGPLLEWKRRFAPEGLREQWLGKAVHDPGRYRELTGQATVRYDGFFPAYRAP